MNVGDRIPEILGIDQDGREIKASDYRGRKIVLYAILRLTQADAQPRLARCKLIKKNLLLQATRLLV